MPPSNASALLAAVTLLGAGLGVTLAEADPAPANSTQVKTIDQIKTADQHKASNQIKVVQQKGSTQVKTIDQVKTVDQVKTSNQIKVTQHASTSH